MFCVCIITFYFLRLFFYASAVTRQPAKQLTNHPAGQPASQPQWQLQIACLSVASWQSVKHLSEFAVNLMRMRGGAFLQLHAIYFNFYCCCHIVCTVRCYCCCCARAHAHKRIKRIHLAREILSAQVSKLYSFYF